MISFKCSTFTNSVACPSAHFPQAIGMGETGIVFSSGVIWKELRYTTHQILKEFGMGTNLLAERIQEEVICYVKKLVEMKGKPVDPQHFTYVSVSNIICSIMFGRRFSYDDPRFKKTVDSLNRVSECARGAGAINFLPFLKYLPGDMFKAKKIQVNWLSVKKVLAEIVFEIERQGKITAKKRNSGNYIFSYRDKQHKNKQIGNATCLDDDNLLKNIIDLFAAGTETVASSIVWCLLFILHTPSVQTKIHEELDREVGQERQPTMEDQARLPYLNAVIKETQRLSNVVPFSVMHKTSEEIKIGDFIIPKGTTLIPNLDSVLHDPEVWGSDAEIFNPDRFLDKDGNVIHREEFIPFSLGPRICVGEAMAKMELFLFLSSMFQRFQFVAKDSKNLPTLKPNIGFTSVPTAFEILCVDRFKKTEALV